MIICLDGYVSLRNSNYVKEDMEKHFNDLFERKFNISGQSEAPQLVVTTQY